MSPKSAKKRGSGASEKSGGMRAKKSPGKKNSRRKNPGAKRGNLEPSELSQQVNKFKYLLIKHKLTIEDLALCFGAHILLELWSRKGP
jgi:hypothetical protein